MDNKVHEVAGGGDGSGAETARSSLAEAVPAPVAPRKKVWAQLTEAQQQACWRLSAKGHDIDSIAQILGLKVSRVKRVVDGVIGRIRVAELRAVEVLGQIDQHFELHEMLPESRKALKAGLTDGSAKVRSDVARWLHEALIAKPVERKELHVTGRLEHDLSPVLETIGKHLSAIREANAGSSHLARVKVGSEVLVRPQIGDGEPETEG